MTPSVQGHRDHRQRRRGERQDWAAVLGDGQHVASIITPDTPVDVFRIHDDLAGVILRVCEHGGKAAIQVDSDYFLVADWTLVVDHVNR